METRYWVGIVLVGVVVLIWWVLSRYKTYYVDSYFLKQFIRGNKDFKYAEIKPYYTEGFYLSYNFGRIDYIAKDFRINYLSGAEVQRIVEGVCQELGLPEGSLYSEVKHPDSVIIKRKDNIDVSK